MSNRDEFDKFYTANTFPAVMLLRHSLLAGWQAACELKDKEIERLNEQVAMLREAIDWYGEFQDDPDSFTTIEAIALRGSVSEWLTAHDSKVRDDAMNSQTTEIERLKSQVASYDKWLSEGIYFTNDEVTEFRNKVRDDALELAANRCGIIGRNGDLTTQFIAGDCAEKIRGMKGVK